MRLYHRPNKKAVTSNVILHHPKEFLEEIVALSIYQLYGLEHSAVLTRQNKAIQAGSNNFIDYVFACFELANVLGNTPNEVAKNIAAQVTKWIAKNHPAMLNKIRAEGVSGYVNFELSDEYMAETAYYVAHWLQKPSTRLAKKKIARILVLGSTIGASHKDLAAHETFQLMSELYRGAGCDVKCHYLLSDASEDAAKNLADLVLTSAASEQKKDKKTKTGSNNDVIAAQFEQKIKAFLGDVEGEDLPTNTAATIEHLRADFIHQAKKQLQDSQLKAEEIELESKQIEKVNQWLDRAVKRRQHIATDGHTRAAYYLIEDGPLASLRSAKGLLFKAAYLLYGLDELMQVAVSNHNKDLVIAIVPQKYHQLLYSHADQVIPKSAYKSFICIDPHVVRSALSHQRALPDLLPKTFKELAHTLGKSVSERAYTTDKRQKLLALMDFPVELNTLIMQVRLLEVVALLNTDLTFAEELAS